MTKRTLGYVPYGTGKVRPFDTIFPQSLHVTPEDIKKGSVDCLVIWGGEDISPTIYNQRVNPHTGATERLSHRDQVEVAVCKAAIETKIPILGICRGAQLLCALAGGKLIQHFESHAGRHDIVCDDGVTRTTNSLHHQMMYPWEVEHKLIAYAPGGENNRHYLDTDVEIEDDHVEPEVVYFPTIKGLAIQGHPEFLNPDHEFVAYSRKLVHQYLLGL